MSLSETDALWQRLDPVFVRGMQRSGTSMMAYALQEMGIVGFDEGHLWFDLVKPFVNLRDPNYLPDYRQDGYALGQGRISQLEKYIGVALDQFHRDHLPSDLKRWMDKSPGADAVRPAPSLASLFPCAQFIFMYRNGITNVHSGLKYWSDNLETFQMRCRGWAETMSAWRKARESLRGRYIEIAQEDMAARPFGTAVRLTDFLKMPEFRQRVADLFRSQRVLSAFPGKRPGDYQYQIDWSAEQKAYFVEMCREEMEIWGYEVDFDLPGSPRGALSSSDNQAMMEKLDEQASHVAELEREVQSLREHLTQVQQGRVMRFLNWLHRQKARLLR